MLRSKKCMKKQFTVDRFIRKVEAANTAAVPHMSLGGTPKHRNAPCQAVDTKPFVFNLRNNFSEQRYPDRKVRDGARRKAGLLRGASGCGRVIKAARKRPTLPAAARWPTKLWSSPAYLFSCLGL